MFKLSRLVLSLALAAAAVAPALAVQGGGLSNTPVKTAAARVTDRANGFSIVPPNGWTKGSNQGKTFMLYLDAPKNNFRANLNVNVSPDDGTPVSRLAGIIKPAFAKQFDKWKAMGEGTTTIAGQPSYFLSSRFSMQGYDIQNLQYYIRGKKNRFYVLTFTALASNYKSYEATFKQTAASVQTMN